MNLSDRLMEKLDEKQNPCVVGLDPVLERIPAHLVKGDSFADIAHAFLRFNRAIIDEVAPVVPCVKPQIAFYEKYGAPGLQAFKDTVDYARQKGLIVIEDGKRGDIFHTVEAYAQGHLGQVPTPSGAKPSLDLDLLTVNPYLGTDGLTPFVNACRAHGKGIFILVKTSNPSAGEFQDRLIDLTPQERTELDELGMAFGTGKTALYHLVALQVHRYAKTCMGNRGYSAIGAVVGATYPEQAEALRSVMPHSFFLVPGYGAQGGTAKEFGNYLNADGYGAVINASRSILFAHEQTGESKDFAKTARQKTEDMVQDVRGAMQSAGKWPAGWKK